MSWELRSARLASAVLVCLLVSSVEGGSVDFDTEIVPALTFAGCNSGACHGAAAGRGGFFLSLFGSDPARDYAAIVLDAEGRRVNVAQPQKSLLLVKPLEQLTHGGGAVILENSPTAKLLKQWIAEGAQRGPARIVKRLRIAPDGPIGAKLNTVQNLRATSVFDTESIAPPNAAANVKKGRAKSYAITIDAMSDATVDVTQWTLLRAEDPTAVEVRYDPLRIIARQPGQHLLTARFRDSARAVVVLVPFPSASEATKSAIENLEHSNYVDAHIAELQQRLGITPTDPADDATFLRRIRLDLTGRLPQLQELESFLIDRTPGKRQRKAEELISSKEFDELLALRLARWWRLRGNPQEPAAGEAYAQWIRKAVASRQSYRDMAKQLLTSEGDAHTQGPVNFARSVSDPRKHAELVSSVLMGVQLQCANCHNHPLDRWTQDDYHGLAAIFATVDRGRMVSLNGKGYVTHPRTGESAVPRLPGARTGEPTLSSSSNLSLDFADWLVDPANPYFAKAIVNRLWQALMGRGLVEPVDDLRETNPASHPALLEQLAKDFIEHDYDLRPTIRQIVSSQAYSLASKPMSVSSHMDQWYPYAIPKPLLPEVMLDAIDDTLGRGRQVTQLEATAARSITRLNPTTPSEELDALGRCSRVAGCDSETPQELSLSTKLHWLNGKLINDRILATDSHLQKALHSGNRDDAANTRILIEFSLRALAREPDERQLARWVAELRSLPEAERVNWLEDFIWALVSSRDFLLNR